MNTAVCVLILNEDKSNFLSVSSKRGSYRL